MTKRGKQENPYSLIDECRWDRHVDWFRLHVFSSLFLLDLWLTSTSHLLHSSQVGSTRLLWCLPWSWPIVSQFHSVSTLHKGVQGNSKLGNSSTKKATPLHTASTSSESDSNYFKSIESYGIYICIVLNLYITLFLCIQVIQVPRISRISRHQLVWWPKKKAAKRNDSYVARHL